LPQGFGSEPTTRELSRRDEHRFATTNCYSDSDRIECGGIGVAANYEMMPFQLTICGIDEIAGHCAAADVTHVLSILDPGWPEPEPLRSFEVNRRLKLHFHDVIESRPGWIAPEGWDVELLLAFGRDLDAAWEPHLLIHCHAGVSRSTAAATLIMAQALPSRPADDVLQEVVRLRPRAWPNLRILELGDELLGRRGEIVEAARAHYRRALEREPWLAETMIEGGRAREVAAAGQL
jgi:predicted protein tyrosine phosphatase